MKRAIIPALARQGGAFTLIGAMLLLFATSIAVFYLNRSTIFEQKSAANQVRSTAAIEAAEAGVEWATGMLNRPYDIRASCDFDTTTNISFRRKYVQTNYANAAAIAAHTNQNIAVAAGVAPGCYLTGTALTCNCPAVGDAVLLPPSALPGFTVSFAAIDNTSVEVTSVGCNALAGACTPAAAAGADATATVKVILKLRPILRAAPASALTCGGSCNLSGSLAISNTDNTVNGITINAGGNINGTAGAITSTPGAPAQNSVIGADQSLSALAGTDSTCANDRVFNAYFGSTLTQYQNNPSVKTISCSSADSCGVAVLAAFADGWRSYFFPNGFELNNSSGVPSLGTQADPVTIVSPLAIKLNGGTDIYGVVYSNDATYGDLGTGNSTVHGAVVTCKDFSGNGNGTISYDAAALKNLQSSSALMVRVPGSWRDF